MHRQRGFGSVGPEEVRQADAFFEALVGPESVAYGESQPRWAEAPESTPVFELSAAVGTRPAPNRGADVAALKDRLIALGYNWITPGRTIDNDTIYTIRLVQSIIRPSNTLRGDGRVDVPGRTHRWLQATNAPRWRTMPAGSRAEGFFNFELSDTSDNHDYGTDWMANTIVGAGAHYRDNYLRTHSRAALLTVNDVSLPRGGDTPDHGGHETGMACDLRLPRLDGTAPGSTRHTSTGLYDQAATRAMLQALRAQSLVRTIYFNDPVLIGEGLCTRKGGHDDHIHFHLRTPTQGAIEMRAAPVPTPTPTPAPTPTPTPARGGSSWFDLDWLWPF